MSHLDAFLEFLINPLVLIIGGYIVDKRAKARVAPIHNQIVNSHTSNLRDDVDEILAITKGHSVHLTRLDGRLDRNVERLERHIDRNNNY